MRAAERYLVLGGSGAVGRYLLRDLARAEAPALALSRAATAPHWAQSWTNLRWQQGDLTSTQSLELQDFSSILSVGPLDHFVRWIEPRHALKHSHVVALSSMSAEWKRNAVHPRERALSDTLIEAEQRLQAWGARHGVEISILRPTLIYGAGVDANLSRLLALARRLRVLPWPLAANGLRQPVHAEDVAAAVLAAACAPHGLGILPLPGGETLSFTEMIDRTLHAAGTGLRRLPLPVPMAMLRPWSRRSGLASMLVRAGEDQLADGSGWAALHENPRLEFAPIAADFQPW